MAWHISRTFAVFLSLVLSIGLEVGCRQLPTKQVATTSASDQTSLSGNTSEAASSKAGSVEQVQHAEPFTASNHVVEPPSELPEVVAVPNAETSTLADPQGVEFFVTTALQSHPRIGAARARVTAACNRVPQAESLEDPLLSNSFFPISDQALQTAAGRAGNTLSLSQKYPWPEKRWTKAAIADREVRIAVAKVNQVELEIEEMVRLAYYELWFANRAISITEENRQVGVELVKLAEARNAAGGSQQDVLRAQLQLDALDDKLIALRQQKAVAQTDLAALIQQPSLVGIEPTVEIDVAQVPERIEALFSAAHQRYPRLR